MAFFDKLKEVGTGLYENLKGLKPIELIGTALEAPLKLTREAISDVLNLVSETDKARTEKVEKEAEQLKNRADRPSDKLNTPSHFDWARKVFEGKPSEVRERIKVENGILRTSYSIDGEFHEAGESVPDPDTMYRNLELRLTGREPQTLDPEKKEFWNVFKHIPKVFTRTVVPNAAALGIIGTIGSLAVPQFIKWAAAISLNPSWLAWTGFGFAAVPAAAITLSLGVYAKTLIQKAFFPRHKVGELYIYEATSGDLSASTLKTNINKETKKLLAQHSIKGEATLEGDIVLGRDMKLSELKAQFNGEEVPPAGAVAVQYFYDAEGNKYLTNDTIKAGTVIPHGTKFVGGVVPESSVYEEMKAFDGSENIFDAASAGTIKLTRNYKLTEPLKLSVPVSLPFDYLDLGSTPPAPRIAGTTSPRGAVIPAGTEMIRGTIIPRNSKREVLAQDISELNEVTELHVRPQMQIGGRIIRRDLYLDEDNKSQFGGITIPTKTRFTIENKTYDATVEDIKKAFKLSSHEPIRQRENSIQVFVDRIPAGAKFPIATIAYVKGGAKHQEGTTPRIGAQESDYKLTDDLDLVEFARTFNCKPENFRLRLSDDIPAGHTIPTFRDESGTTWETGKRIPAGIEIPAKDSAGKPLELPKNLVIPGGSEVYDVSKKPETKLKTAQKIIDERIRQIALDDLKRASGAGATAAISNDQLKTVLIYEAQDAFDLLNEPLFTRDQIHEYTQEIQKTIAKRIQEYAIQKISVLAITGLTGADSAAKKLNAYSKPDVLAIQLIISQIDNTDLKKIAEDMLDRTLEGFAQ